MSRYRGAASRCRRERLAMLSRVSIARSTRSSPRPTCARSSPIREPRPWAERRKLSPSTRSASATSGAASSATRTSRSTEDRASAHGRTAFVLWARELDANLAPQRRDPALDAVESERKHARPQDLQHDLRRARVAPRALGLGVQPYRVAIGVDQPLEPGGARLVVHVLDAASRLHDLVGTHGRVANQD